MAGRKHKFIKAAVGENKGKFKAKAEAAGKSTQEPKRSPKIDKRYSAKQVGR